jgi:hypothetical protein
LVDLAQRCAGHGVGTHGVQLGVQLIELNDPKSPLPPEFQPCGLDEPGRWWPRVCPIGS